MLGVLDDLEPKEVRGQDTEDTEQNEASQPRPLVMSGTKRAAEPTDRNAPPRPAISPPNTTAAYCTGATFTPLTSSAFGLSPAQRRIRP